MHQLQADSVRVGVRSRRDFRVLDALAALIRAMGRLRRVAGAPDGVGAPERVVGVAAHA